MANANNSGKNSPKVIIIVLLALFAIFIVVAVYLVENTLGKDVSFQNWVSASQKFSNDAKERKMKNSFKTCPSDIDVRELYKQHKKEFDLINTMFIEDKLDSLNSLYAYHNDGRLATYPYVDKLDLGESYKKATFVIPQKRYDTYRKLMKSCKVDWIISLSDEKHVCVGFEMFSESLENGIDAENAKFFKRKGVCYLQQADFKPYQTTDAIKPKHGFINGAAQLEPQSHWYIWLCAQLPVKK